MSVHLHANYAAKHTQCQIGVASYTKNAIACRWHFGKLALRGFFGFAGRELSLPKNKNSSPPKIKNSFSECRIFADIFLRGSWSSRRCTTA
jgi:hypothetical protein